MTGALAFMSTYGITTVILAVLINTLTGLTKLPVKALANKLKDSTRITRFLVFMPIIYGFVLTVTYSAILNRTVIFDGGFYRLWLSSGSLSLTFYAVFEKLFPSKKKVLTADELDANKQLIEEIKNATGVNTDNAETSNSAEQKPHNKQRFILGKRNNEETETEK